MNTKYELGPVIRNEEDFNDFKFPAQLPTEEWKGDEARSYDNYLRPIANLFENDRTQESFIKDFIKGTFDTSTNSVINGCLVVKTPNNYYEVTKGAFINNGVVYYLFPACEAAAKQIESKVAATGHDIVLKIWYDGVYHYSYSIDMGETQEGSKNTAAETIGTILAALTSFSIGMNVEDSIVLPIFNVTDNNTKFYFNGSAVVTGASPTNTATVFAEKTGNTITSIAVNSRINGAKLSDNSVPNTSLANNFIKIGSTSISLGSSSASFANVNSINGIKQKIDTNGLHIESEDYSIVSKGNYTLNAACERAVDSSSLSTDAALPTSSAVKSYVSSYVNTQAFTGNIEFNNGIKVTSGAIKQQSSADAAFISGNVSGNASIYTAGGIEAVGNIYAQGDIRGRNIGVASKKELKDNITPFIESAVDLINTIDIVNFTYKSDEERNHKIGFIADDTHEYFSTKNHDMMDQSNCIGLLLKAIQELSAENKELKERINGIQSGRNA